MTRVHCEHCLDDFEVSDALRGGIANCPSCGKANEVEGNNDPLWLLVRVLTVLGAVGIGYFVSRHAGPSVGILVGMVLTILAWLVSRAL